MYERIGGSNKMSYVCSTCQYVKQGTEFCSKCKNNEYNRWKPAKKINNNGFQAENDFFEGVQY